MIHPVTSLLVELSRARMGAPAGVWSDSPDLAGWLLANGRDYPDKKVLPPNRINHCFPEAQKNALKNPNLTYCEGYAKVAWVRLAVPHGWCVDKNGRVTDTIFGSDGTHYFGVPFKTSFVIEFRAQAKEDTSILLWREAGWPIQSGKIPSKKWRQEN